MHGIMDFETDSPVEALFHLQRGSELPARVLDLSIAVAEVPRIPVHSLQFRNPFARMRKRGDEDRLVTLSSELF